MKEARIMGEEKQKTVVEVLEDLHALVNLAGVLVCAGTIEGSEDYINGRLDALASFSEGIKLYIEYYKEIA